MNYIALFQTLKRNYAVNGDDMYWTCEFLYSCVTHIWTRTVTEIPTVTGLCQNVLGFTLLIYCTVFNANRIFFII